MKYLLNLLLLIFLFFIAACKNAKRPAATEIIKIPEQMDARIPDIIRPLLSQSRLENGKIDDSLSIKNSSIVDSVYLDQNYSNLWSDKGKWKGVADSLADFIQDSKLYGLFPEDYHFLPIRSIRSRMVADSFSTKDRMDAALWARADVLLTDAVVQILKDIKLGRLPADSVTLRKDSALTSAFFNSHIRTIVASGSIAPVIRTIESVHPGYLALKGGIQNFLDSADLSAHVFISFPSKDFAGIRKLVQQRLYEAGLIESNDPVVDTFQLAAGLRKYQKKSGLTVDGKIGPETIRSLNDFDKEKFIRIAINLDRYKLLPEEMPAAYVWVNIPAYSMALVEAGVVKFSSKVVVGKPHTRTPVLTSTFANMVTYPQWTIPLSIIAKEILPGLKKDPGYTIEKGYMLIDANGDEIDPYFVDWSLYTRTIPYKVVQGSGDDNALGVLKFNFNNKYQVYLHDTNQRYLFSRTSRALSHGCVRVQEWEKLAYYLLGQDTLVAENVTSTASDTLRQWLRLKQKRIVGVRNKLPLFIRYFTCEGNDSKVVFYDDIYGEDRRLRDRYFHDK